MAREREGADSSNIPLRLNIRAAILGDTIVDDVRIEAPFD